MSTSIISEIPTRQVEGYHGEESPEVMTAEVDPNCMSSSSSGAGERGNSESELPIDMSLWTLEELAAYNNLRSKRKKCCIGGCTHRSIPIARSYHQLPVRNQDVWVKWVEIIRWSRNEPGWSPNGDAAPLVCSRHFPDSDFISYEASSRVRLSHSAIPMYYVDPPVGTKMDPQFSIGPLPIPPPILVGTGKKGAKLKKANDPKEEFCKTTNFESQNVPTYYSDNLDYDIEEVKDEEEYGHDDTTMRMEYDDDSNHVQQYGSNIPYQNVQQAINYSTSNRSVVNAQSRRSAPPALRRHQVQKTATKSLKNKPPALIRTNFSSLHSSPQSNIQENENKVFEQPQILLARNRTPPSQSQTTKHKIGLAKCKLIVQTLENQLKIAKRRLAEQLDLPFQVVNGVWNMKDALKDRLNE